MYRSPPVLEPAEQRDAVASVSMRIDALRSELEHRRQIAERAQARAEAVLRSEDARVTRAEETRRRALLRALASAPDTARADGLRAALRAERRERDLRAALTRARPVRPLGDADAAAPTAPCDEAESDAAKGDVERTRQALARAREGRARDLAPALAAAREARTQLDELERSLDELERERERLGRMSER